MRFAGEEPVAGTIYVSRNSLYLTITPTKSKRVSGFVPSTAARIERAPAYAAEWAPGTLAIVIDHQVLAKAQTPTVTPGAAEQDIPPPSPAAVTPVARPAFKQESPSSAQAFPISTSSGDPAATEKKQDELLKKKLDEIRQLREANTTKDSELAMLRREVEWMKQELRQRTAELKSAKASITAGRPSPKKKSAEAYRTR